jgi:hypothetical protein
MMKITTMRPNKIAANESVLAVEQYSVFRHAVKPELKLIKVLLLIALQSSPQLQKYFFVLCCTLSLEHF